jgi:hypothetical protein
MAKTADPRQTIRIPLVGSYYKRDSSASSSLDQIFVNCAFKKQSNPATGKDTVVTSKRLGFSSYQVTTGTTTAIDSLYFPVFDYTAPMVLWSNGTDAKLKVRDTTLDTFSGYGSGQCSRLSPCWSTSPTLQTVAVWNVSTGGVRSAKYYVNGVGVSSISDVDFPSSSICGNFAFMDGYLFIMTEDGFIYNSDLNDLSSWDATNFLSAGFKSDEGTTLARYKNTIVAFGRSTTEFFENVGNATGSPLQRMLDRSFNVGLYKDDTSSSLTSPTSSCRRVLEAFDTVFWISGSFGDKTSQCIYYLDNFAPAELSTPDIKSVFSYDSPDKIIGAFHYAGEPVVMIKTVSGDYYVCFTNLKMWSKWSFGTGTPVAVVGGASQTVFADMGVTQVKMTFNAQTSASYRDNGSTYTLTIQTSKLDLDTEKRKRLHKLAIIGNTTTSASDTDISWSDDDYSTFNSVRTVSLSSPRPYITNGGAFRRRAFKLTNSSNAPFEVEALELDISLLSS